MTYKLKRLWGGPLDGNFCVIPSDVKVYAASYIRTRILLSFKFCTKEIIKDLDFYVYEPDEKKHVLKRIHAFINQSLDKKRCISERHINRLPGWLDVSHDKDTRRFKK